METLLQQILTLLVQPPGNLIYHLVLAFSVVAGLQAVLIARRASPYPHAGRLVFGLAMLLFGQVVLFFSSALAWQGVLDQHQFLPPLDRAVLMFSAIWIVWLWNFAAPTRLGDTVTGFLTLGLVLLFLFTYTGWAASGAGADFNDTWMDWTWELAAAFIVLTGMALLLFTRPAGWGYGLGMLSLMLAGFVAHLAVQPSGGDLSGIIRLGQIAAFPLLPTLLNRLSLPVGAAAAASGPAGITETAPSDAVARVVPVPRSQERRHYSTDPRTVHAWLELNLNQAPEKQLEGLSKALGQTMLADLCFLVSGPSDGYLALQSGYDLIREEMVSGILLEQGQVPTLASSVQRGRPLRFRPDDSRPLDFKALADALSLNTTGSLMFVPLTLAEKPQGGLLFLSPYSNRVWSAEDQTYLASELELIARIVANAKSAAEAASQPASAAANTGELERLSQALRAEIDQLRQENQKQLTELVALRTAGSASEPAASQPELDALVALQQETQEQVTRLQAENDRLQAAISGTVPLLSPSEYQRMEIELRAALEEMALLQNQLAQANARTMILEQGLREASEKKDGGDNSEVVASLAQELRQPMSSILGYTDLLLSESVGLLGDKQRKFIERIKASTERMRIMLDDLIRVAAPNQAAASSSLPRPLAFAEIVDSAIAETSAQLREKDITLRVDLPVDVPLMYGDRDALQQIVVHLLQNAGGATPSEGTITLRARPRQETGHDYLLLQVSDTGGGVRTEDLQRVFARRYHAKEPLIQGIGDTGISLSLVKSLVDTQNGRIWADSVNGQGTTFSVLLPARPRFMEQAGQ